MSATPRRRRAAGLLARGCVIAALVLAATSLSTCSDPAGPPGLQAAALTSAGAAGPATPAPLSPRAAAPARLAPERVAPEVLAALSSAGQAQVIINLRDPLPLRAPDSERRAAVAAAQRAVLARLDSAGPGSFQLRRRFALVPALAGRIDAAGLAAVADLDPISLVQIDEPSGAHLTESVPALHGDAVRTMLGVRGKGITVAIIDTGVDLAHKDIGPAVTAQHCFTQASCPPNNTNEGTSAQDAAGHGTNVAGVVTSDGLDSPIGFAPDTAIIAVRVLDGHGAGFLSDWVSGLDWLANNLGQNPVQVVNLSLGTNALYVGGCDGAQPSSATAVGLLTAKNVVVFASSGNAGSATSTAAPACNTGVIAVGATYDSDLKRQPGNGTYFDLFGGSWPRCFDASATLDVVTCFTNSSSKVSMLAPGAQITSAGLGGGTSTYIGTSQASPTAAAVAALMLSIDPRFTPATIEALLQGSGPLLTDAKNNLQFHRIDALAAVQAAQMKTCQGKADGVACDDGNPCTRTDACKGGLCVGGNPVVCVAKDQCHAVGQCDPQSGQCSNPSKPLNTPCDDGDACTQKDLCVGGVCKGTMPVVCVALDGCHDVGTCDPRSGKCSSPSKPDGVACDDGNACTRNDSCLGGVCTGKDPVVCTALDACHSAGSCDPQSGTCSNPSQPDGTACDDGNACTRSDRCAGGVCRGESPVVCAALDACHAAGTCDPRTGACSNPVRPDGTACDDGNACSLQDRCRAGVCQGGAAKSCTAIDACHRAGACDPGTGACSNPAQPDGTACDDGQACTHGDVCSGGACGGTAYGCTASDCQSASVCDGRGGCQVTARADGTACAGGSCAAGVCQAHSGCSCALGSRAVGGGGHAAGAPARLAPLFGLALLLLRRRRRAKVGDTEKSFGRRARTVG